MRFHWGIVCFNFIVIWIPWYNISLVCCICFTYSRYILYSTHKLAPTVGPSPIFNIFWQVLVNRFVHGFLCSTPEASFSTQVVTFDTSKLYYGAYTYSSSAYTCFSNAYTRFWFYFLISRIVHLECLMVHILNLLVHMLFVLAHTPLFAKIQNFGN